MEANKTKKTTKRPAKRAIKLGVDSKTGSYWGKAFRPDGREVVVCVPARD